MVYVVGEVGDGRFPLWNHHHRSTWLAPCPGPIAGHESMTTSINNDVRHKLPPADTRARASHFPFQPPWTREIRHRVSDRFFGFFPSRSVAIVVGALSDLCSPGGKS